MIFAGIFMGVLIGMVISALLGGNEEREDTEQLKRKIALLEALRRSGS